MTIKNDTEQNWSFLTSKYFYYLQVLHRLIPTLTSFHFLSITSECSTKKYITNVVNEL